MAKVTSINSAKKKGLSCGENQEVDLDRVRIEENFNAREKLALDDHFIESIRKNGVQNPIHVREGDDGFLYVVDGHRRLTAARATGNARIRIINHGKVSAADALLLSMIGEQRRSWAPADYMNACGRLSNLGFTVDQIAKVVGKGRRTIENYLAVNKGGPRLKDAVAKPSRKGNLSPAVAASAATLSVSAQNRVIPKIRGKSDAEALEAIREEKAAKGGTRGLRVYDCGMPKPIDYKLASDYKERCKALEAGITERLQRRPGDKDLLGMQKTIKVLKGKMSVEDAFVRWDGL
jgi:ParB/RepB/Spo0J family partition protein